jgi:hypothetical protein
MEPPTPGRNLSTNHAIDNGPIYKDFPGVPDILDLQTANRMRNENLQNNNQLSIARSLATISKQFGSLGAILRASSSSSIACRIIPFAA